MNKTGLISMFLQGSGLSSDEIDRVYAEPQVAFELQQTPLDARGVYDAIFSAVRIHGHADAVADMRGAANQIMFMNIVDAVNQK